MASPTLQFKRGLFLNLPELRAGEPGFTTDKSDLFIGIGGTVGDNKFFGSHRYWTREDGTASAEFKLVDKDGTNGVSLRSPATVNTPVTYTLPQGDGIVGNYLKLGSEGVLEWASISEGASFDNATLINTTFSGVSTFTGLIDAQAGLGVTGGSTFDDINVTGVGTINHLVYNSSSTSGISTVGELYVGETQVISVEGGELTLSNIEAIDAITKATLEATLALDPNDFDSLNIAGIATFSGFIDAKAGLGVTGGSTFDDVNVTGVATFSNAIDADILGNAGTATSLADARDFSVSGDVETSVSVPFDGTDNVDLIVTLSSTFSANTSGIITATGGFVGDLTGNAGTATSLANARNFDISGDFITAASVSFDGTGNVSLAATITENSIELGKYTTGDYVADITGTDNEVTVSGTGEGASVTIGLPNEVIVGTSLSAPTVYVGAIKAEDGADAIFIDDVTGNVSFASTVTITGDLQVLGSTTTINTETLLVKDPVIDIGLVNNDGDLVAPSAPTATDLALVFHYYDSSAKQSSLYWDHDNENGERFILASTLTGHTVGTATTSVEASAYAALEVGTLWVNNACSGGAQEVIGCNGNSELALMNIVVDAGEF
jgi:hypothetical protein